MISIIVSTIGNCSEQYMQDAMLSALKTSVDITKEIIIIENSQNDKIYNFLAQYETDKRVTIYRSDTRLDMADCWNLGLEKCSEKWHLLLHDDDIIKADIFNSLDQNLLKSKNVGFISFDFFLLKNHKIKRIRRAESIEGIIENTPKFVSTIVHNDNFNKVGGWDKKAGYALDLLQFIKLHQTYSSIHIGKALGIHRIHNNNASNRSKREDGYSKDLPYLITQIYLLINDTELRRKVTFHLSSFSYPHKKILSRIISFLLGKIGKKIWFEKG